MALCKFQFRTGRVVIDHERCGDCDSYACVKACSLFGRNLLRIHDGRPALIADPDETGRMCIECLACEHYCRSYGKKALKINLDALDLD